MQLDSLHIINFKNYENTRFDFHKKINVFTGSNGSGKTNALDAIYFLCLTKSFRSHQDVICTRHNLDFFRIDSHWKIDGKTHNLIAKYRVASKQKEIELDGVLAKKMQHHIGKFPVVTVLPDDVSLINGGGENRRRWLDIMVGQTNSKYIVLLLEHNKLLMQRNAYFKQVQHWAEVNHTWLDTIEEQLMSRSKIIYEIRLKAINEWLVHFELQHLSLSLQNEQVTIVYKSHWEKGDIMQKLKERRAIDFQLKRSSVGVQHDDISIETNTIEAKKIASQGQLKTILLALKLAELEWISKNTEHKPILLLDDIFDRLDPHRIQQLLREVARLDVQVFITDTDAQRMTSTLINNGLEHTLIAL